MGKFIDFFKKVDAYFFSAVTRSARMFYKQDRAQRFFESLLEMKLASNYGKLPDRTTEGLAGYRATWGVVPAAFSGLQIHTGGIVDGVEYSFVWGSQASDANVTTLYESIYDNSLLMLCEDGFLKSADTWANNNAPERFRQGCSCVVDSRGYYFDATRPTVIEQMLNDPEIKLDTEKLARARRLIDLIVEKKLTKYNHQPIQEPMIGRPGHRKVLVVDQSYGDFSISRGWASDETFKRMLNDAINENPDSDIIVKTHPDTMTGTRAGYFQDVPEGGRVFRMTEPVNPYSLINICDRVYVCSTQFGFEALMAGKEVHVYGMPFYAGWGLTNDRQKNPRRVLRRSLEEVFYIFYIMYTHWCNPDTGSACEIEEAIDWLLKIRKEYSDYKCKHG